MIFQMTEYRLPWTINCIIIKSKLLVELKAMKIKMKSKFIMNDMCTCIGRIKAIFFDKSKTNNQSY